MKLRTSLTIAGGLAAIAVVLAIVYYAWERAGAAKVAEALAQLRAAGEPTSYSDVEALYFDQTGSQAGEIGELWLAAVRPFSTAEFSERTADFPVIGEPDLIGFLDEEFVPAGQTWESREQVETLLAEFAESMSLLHLAGELGPVASFDLDVYQGISMLMEHTEELLPGAKMLVLEAYLRGHEGDASGAANSIVSGLRLARAMEGEPVSIAQLVSSDIARVGLRTLERLLPHVNFSEADLTKLQAAVEQLEYRQAMRRALMAERAIHLETFQDPAPVYDYIGANAPLLGPRHDDILLMLSLYQPVIDDLDVSWQRALASAALIDQQITDSQKSPVSRIQYSMTGALMPSLEIMVEAGACAEARRNVHLALLAVARYRLAAGEFPEKLANVVPDYLDAVPSDPFDGQPIRYVVTEDEVRVYSIGSDQTDDGGQRGEFDFDTTEITAWLPLRQESSEAADSK